MYDPSFWKPLTAIIWLKYCRNVLHGRLKAECVGKKNIQTVLQSVSKTAWMNGYYELVHVCTDPSLHNSRTFGCCRCRGARSGDTVLLRTWASWPPRNREIFEKYPPAPKRFPARRPPRNLKSRGPFSGTIYVTGRYSAGARYFSGMGNYLVCIAKRSCSCLGVCRGHITTQK